MSGDKIYKINQPVKVVFQPLGGQTGITDMTMIVIDPQGNESTPVTMTEYSGALYEAEFTPDELGRWWVKVLSYTYTENAQKESYLVGEQEGTIGVILTDTEGHTADITPAGRLKVSQEVVAPPGTTPVNQGGQTTVIKQGGTNNFDWTIPSGETFTLQRLEFGAYIPKDGDYTNQAKCEIWWRPNGNNTGQELVAVIYLQGESDKFRDLNQEFVGDGTAELRLRVRNYSVENIECARFMRGYY